MKAAQGVLMGSKLPVVGILDLPRSNSASVRSGFESVGVSAKILTLGGSSDRNYDALVLPGVGSFGPAANYLAHPVVSETVRQHLAEQKPLLGICLGMQLLGVTSEESPEAIGLGLLRASSKRLEPKLHGLIPNVGWHQVSASAGESEKSNERLNGWFYFSHSYHLKIQGPEAIATISEGDSRIVVAAKRDNIVGVQFHPERSGSVGLRFMLGFAEGDL